MPWRNLKLNLLKHQASKSIAKGFDRKSFKVNSWTGTVLWMSPDCFIDFNCQMDHYVQMLISNAQAEEKQINTIIKHFKKNSHANLEQPNTKLYKNLSKIKKYLNQRIFWPQSS